MSMKTPRPTIKTCEIVGTQAQDETVQYVIRVTTQAGAVWVALKRYSQFEEFHYMLLECVAEHTLPAGCDLPGKRFKWWSSHTSPAFIEERALILENYLQKLTQVPNVANSELFVGFLATDRQNMECPPKVTAQSMLQQAVFPDDVEVTDVSIPQTRLMTDHVLYQVDVANVRKRKSFQRWTVLKRFAQFLEMDEALREAFAHRPDVLSALPNAPERYSKIFYDHMEDHFVEHRRLVLEHYMQKLMLVTPVLYEPIFLAFLGVNV